MRGRVSRGHEPLAAQLQPQALAANIGRTPEEISASYEQWMKLAADNKINVANSWTLGLIDYFADMTILREHGAINFQKASCTLDGCVKIYTTRVDSVATETEKLVSGLNDSKQTAAASRAARHRNNDDDDDDDGDGAHEPEGEVVERRKRTRKANTKTLEKDFNAITTKKYDLEFMVDPLFRKTCAEFDEGGAKALLFNRLDVFGEGLIAFDASDMRIDEDAGTAGAGTAHVNQGLDQLLLLPVPRASSDPVLAAANRPARAVRTARPRPEPVYFDFATMEPVNVETLFAPGGASINLPRTTEDRPAHKHQIVVKDVFNPAHLARLFIKPHFTLAPPAHVQHARGRRSVRGNAGGGGDPIDVYGAGPAGEFAAMMAVLTAPPDRPLEEPVEEDEEDEGRAVNEAADAAGRRNVPPPPPMPPMDNDGDFPIPPMPQDPAVPGPFDIVPPPASTQTVAAAPMPSTSAIRQRLVLNYAKRAKRVDVKRLKETMWRKIRSRHSLARANAARAALTAEDSPQQQQDGQAADPALHLKSVVAALADDYSADKIKDISVPFCFICLLHLANEKNLRLESAIAMDDVVVLPGDEVGAGVAAAVPASS
ncbi:hypothetical protein AMAG_20578 [Allomyces macrogynus ATCC 38327]|uniref:Condensin complex subunit 2 n=1 Tax=Allomyces macrogynus (strain ATCC 38327) TaxID=578462 RepID=A0A0L0TD16_ALLM3|nr:hypothetical protein AMAG_20578 [Allomyces macrogynus ATCC 38327]|eukprot:KNE72803.1 hypothetical protein AMAG_20578 [Allomyces macrogynus ATCC 38327]